jgi:hypothetical protein
MVPEQHCEHLLGHVWIARDVHMLSVAGSGDFPSHILSDILSLVWRLK